MRRINESFGFTILELLMVMALVSILSSAGMASYAHIHTKLTQKSVATKIENTLSKARQSALLLRQDVYVSIDKTQNCVGLSLNAVCNCAKDGDCHLNGTEQSIALEENTLYLDDLVLSQGSYIKFDARLGTAAGNNGSFVLGSSLAKIRIITSAFGRTRLCMQAGHVAGVRAC